jgi:hypothetical protein
MALAEVGLSSRRPRKLDVVLANEACDPGKCSSRALDEIFVAQSERAGRTLAA